MAAEKASVAVIGGGPWGLALAAAAARTGKPTILHSRRMLDGSLPRGVTQARDFAEIAERARLIVLAVPSEAARSVARMLGDVVDGRHLVVHGVRGLAGAAMDTISEVVRQETPARRVGALGGPALSDDLLAGRPCVMVCGSHYPEVNAALERAFVSPTLRMYTTSDLRGLEWASALVGCLAIGIGYAQALGASPGLVAATIARSVSEAARLAAAAGGEERTLLGLAGYGDLLASIGQEERPEILLGKALANGKTLSEATREAKLRVEAIELIPRIVAWSEQHGVRAPIFTALGRGVLSSRPAKEIVHDLMTGPVDEQGY
jgi:glycerol-3-phosphate dehydrogenase (NAD(P)+)